MKIKAFIAALCALFCLQTPAFADMGVPMLSLVWPLAWHALILVILGEALVARLVLKTGPQKSFLVAAKANLISTVIGVPACWIAALIVFGLIGVVYYAIPRDEVPSSISELVTLTILSSPWLGFGVDLQWLVPAAMVCLNVVFFFGSVAVEYFVARTDVPAPEMKTRVALWSWLANGLSYSVILTILWLQFISVIDAHRAQAFGYIDKTGKLVLSPKASELSEFEGGYAPVRVRRKWGFIDKSGNFVVKPQFDYVRPFRSGIAAFEDNGKWGFVDQSGVIKAKPEYGFLGDFKNGRAAARKGDKTGWVDADGAFVPEDTKEVLSEIASTEQKDNNRRYRAEFGPRRMRSPDEPQFSEGLRAAAKDVPPDTKQPVRFGFVDRNRNWVIPPKYEEAANFHDGLAAVKVNGLWGFIDHDGKMVVLPQFKNVSYFSDGLCAVGERWMYEEH